MSNGRVVEIRQAWEWTCDDCGRDSYERAVLVDPSAIDPDDLPDAANLDAEKVRAWIDEGGSGQFVVAPERVTCPHCGASFDTVPV